MDTYKYNLKSSVYYIQACFTMDDRNQDKKEKKGMRNVFGIVCAYDAGRQSVRNWTLKRTTFHVY